MNLMRPPRPNANAKRSYSTVPKAGPGIRAADLAKLAKVRVMQVELNSFDPRALKGDGWFPTR